MGTYIANMVTKVNRLRWDQQRTMQNLITGLNNHLKSMVMMKSPATLQEACRVIGTAKMVAKAQSAQWDRIQSTLKDLVNHLKLDNKDNKVAAVQPSPPPPSKPQTL